MALRTLLILSGAKRSRRTHGRAMAMSMTFLRLALRAFVLAAAAPAARALTITEVTSAGGITAWLVEDHSLPVVTIDFDFRGGAALDPAAKPGLANLACELLDEGAGDLDSSA